METIQPAVQRILHSLVLNDELKIAQILSVYNAASSAPIRCRVLQSLVFCCEYEIPN